jgi:hypothetical protein
MVPLDDGLVPLLPMGRAPDPAALAPTPYPSAFGVVAITRPPFDIMPPSPDIAIAVPVPMTRLPYHGAAGRRRHHFRAWRRDRRIGWRRRRLCAGASDADQKRGCTDNKPLHRQTPQRQRSRPVPPVTTPDTTSGSNLGWHKVSGQGNRGFMANLRRPERPGSLQSEAPDSCFRPRLERFQAGHKSVSALQLIDFTSNFINQTVPARLKLR